EIVPGDLLLLSSGMIVPADARIIEGEELGADESALTGESVVVVKSAAPVSVSAPFAERTCMLYRGTAVVSGAGIAIVTAIGPQTELAHIQLLAAGAQPPPTPLERQIDELGRTLVIATLFVSGAVLIAGLLRGYTLSAM